MFAFGETVTVLTAAVVADPYDGESDGEDWQNPAELDVDHVGVASGGSIEDATNGADTVDSDFDLIFPADAVVNTANRVVVRGLVCQVAGSPFLWSNPFTGWTPGLVVKAKIRQGG